MFKSIACDTITGRVGIFAGWSDESRESTVLSRQGTGAALDVGFAMEDRPSISDLSALWEEDYLAEGIDDS